MYYTSLLFIHSFIHEFVTHTMWPGTGPGPCNVSGRKGKGRQQ